MKELNYERVFNTLVEETRNYITRNNLSAMVLGISGGIDSTVVATICYEVSRKTDIPLIGRSLPIKNGDTEFGVSKLVGEAFCKDFKVVNLLTTFQQVNQVIYDKEGTLGTPISKGNIQARLRMIYLYNLASINNGLVMSTDNQTEYQLGFWTLHGDVGDFNPLQGLWKTEVYGLAKYILRRYEDRMISLDEGHFYKEEDRVGAMHRAVIESIGLTPTDGLGISNSDLDQIGVKSYYDVDRILQTLVCPTSLENTKVQDALTEELGAEVVGKVIKRRTASQFKRKWLPISIDRSKYE